MKHQSSISDKFCEEMCSLWHSTHVERREEWLWRIKIYMYIRAENTCRHCSLTEAATFESPPFTREDKAARIRGELKIRDSSFFLCTLHFTQLSSCRKNFSSIPRAFLLFNPCLPYSRESYLHFGAQLYFCLPLNCMFICSSHLKFALYINGNRIYHSMLLIIHNLV